MYYVLSAYATLPISIYTYPLANFIQIKYVLNKHSYFHCRLKFLNQQIFLRYLHNEYKVLAWNKWFFKSSTTYSQFAWIEIVIVSRDVTRSEFQPKTFKPYPVKGGVQVNREGDRLCLCLTRYGLNLSPNFLGPNLINNANEYIFWFKKPAW